MKISKKAEIAMRALSASKSRVWAALLIAALAGQVASAAEREFDKKFSVTPGGTLRVEIDFGGITVSGGDSNEVVVRATLSGTENQIRNFDISADSDNRGVTVRGRGHGNRWLDLSWLFGSDLRAKFAIQVPRDYHVELRTAGGSIESRNIHGNLYGRTSGGRILLDSVSGTIDVYTSGGRVEARQINGDARLRTSGGGITVADAKGDLDVRTSGGGIRLQGVEGRIEARTSGGGIDADIRGVNRGVQLRTSGGGIRVDVAKEFKARVDAHTSGGTVYCELPVNSQDDRDRAREFARDERRPRDSEENSDRDYRRDDDSYKSRDKKTVLGDINGGGPDLVLRTSGGSIRIRAN